MFEISCGQLSASNWPPRHPAHDLVAPTTKKSVRKPFFNDHGTDVSFSTDDENVFPIFSQICVRLQKKKLCHVSKQSSTALNMIDMRELAALISPRDERPHGMRQNEFFSFLSDSEEQQRDETKNERADHP